MQSYKLDHLFRFPHKEVLQFFDNVFLYQLNKENVLEIFSWYAEKGNNLSVLRGLLFWLCDRPQPAIPQYRGFITNLTRCKNSVQTLLRLSNLPRPLKSAANNFLQTIELCLTEREHLQRGTKITKREDAEESRKTGKKLRRPPGPTRDSLILAVISKEFRLRMNGPRFGDVAALAKAVAPNKFPIGTDADHIRQRIRQVPESKIDEYHKAFFTPHRKNAPKSSRKKTSQSPSPK